MGLQFSPLLSSSSGNASLVATDKTALLIDAGATGSAIEKAISEVGQFAGRLDGILITHEHTDHIKGAGVLSRKYNLPIYATAGTWEQMSGKIGEVASRNMRVIDGHEFLIGDICAQPIALSHDAADPVGYAIMGGGRKVSILTDTGKVTTQMLDAAAGSTIVLLESNHDIDMLRNGEYPYRLKNRILSTKGHLSNVDAGQAAVELFRRGVRGILLGHLSSHNNLKQLAYDTVYNCCMQAGIAVGKEMALATANRHSVTGTYQLK